MENSKSPIGEDTPLSLLDGLRQEREDAWARFVEVWAPLIYASCRRRGFSPVDAEDISQSVLVRVYLGVGSFQRDGVGNRLRFWIAGILRNEVAEFCRQRARQPLLTGGSDYQFILNNLSVPESDSDDDCFSPARLMARVLTVIRQDFQEKNWHAFELVEFERLSNEETGAKLGMSANAVRQATFRIRKRLREELKDLLD